MTMTIAVLDANTASGRGHWMEAHKAGCQHLRQGDRRYGQPIGTDAWTFEVETLEDAAEEIASDFIEEGSMTLADALNDIHFAPCLDDLPRRPEVEPCQWCDDPTLPEGIYCDRHTAPRHRPEVTR